MGNENTHWLERLMENPWMLLILGIVVPTISYTVWGVYDVLSLPVAPLP